MTPELFSDLAYDLAMGSGPNADDLVSACDDLVAQARAEASADAEKLRAELAETTHVLEVTGEKLETVRGQRDRLAEQVKDTEQAVHAYFADADQRGIHLDGMTVDELCDAVMAEIRKGPGR